MLPPGGGTLGRKLDGCTTSEPTQAAAPWPSLCLIDAPRRATCELWMLLPGGEEQHTLANNVDGVSAEEGSTRSWGRLAQTRPKVTERLRWGCGSAAWCTLVKAGSKSGWVSALVLSLLLFGIKHFSVFSYMPLCQSPFSHELHSGTSFRHKSSVIAFLFLPSDCSSSILLAGHLDWSLKALKVKCELSMRSTGRRVEMHQTGRAEARPSTLHYEAKQMLSPSATCVSSEWGF